MVIQTPQNGTGIIKGLKFGEALHFYIHPSFEPKNTFSSYSFTFSSKFDFIYIFYRNGKCLVKKDYFYLMKKRHLC